MVRFTYITVILARGAQACSHSRDYHLKTTEQKSLKPKQSHDTGHLITASEIIDVNICDYCYAEIPKWMMVTKFENVDVSELIPIS